MHFQDMPNPIKLTFFVVTLSRRTRVQLTFAIKKCRHRTLHEIKGLSFSMELMTSDPSFVGGLPDLGFSHNGILSSRKCLRHSFTVRKTSASASHTKSNWVAIAQAGKRSSMRNRMAAHCSMDIRNA
jgi:hypothetical protein